MQTRNHKPKYVNNSHIIRPALIQAPAQWPPVPAQAPAPERMLATVYVNRQGQLVKRQLDELTRKEREDLEQAARRAAYVAMFNPCGLA